MSFADANPLSPLVDGSIYEGIEGRGLSTDLRGWHSTDPVFAAVIRESLPNVIVEVGSWKGASAIHMAGLTRAMHTRIVCIDTWLAGFSLMAGNASPVPREHGYPTIYFQFLHNVKAAGYADRIVPLPMTSRDGARFLSMATEKPRLIYIDASHIYEDVLADLEDYWALLAPGGILFGDDYPMPDVQRAVDHFSGWERLKLEVRGRFFILRKPPVR